MREGKVEGLGGDREEWSLNEVKSMTGDKSTECLGPGKNV